MLTDLLLAIGHHLLVFALAAVLAAELATVRPGIGAAELRRLGMLDAFYGTIAGLIIVVGVLRVNFGAKGPEYYLANHAFWGKITAFVVVGLLSVPPTLRFIAWRRRLKADPAFRPGEAEVLAARRFLWGEVAVFPLILIFAAAMARGYGM
jgi:putative membrane protein